MRTREAIISELFEFEYDADLSSQPGPVAAGAALPLRAQELTADKALFDRIADEGSRSAQMQTFH
jgi:hypothetical protein